MARVWNVVSVLLLVLGLLWATLADPTAIDAVRAGDHGGALASAVLRLVPFALAARWSRNAATGKRTGRALRIILILWVVGGLAQMAAPQP